jgi:hypothetical protein
MLGFWVIVMSDFYIARFIFAIAQLAPDFVHLGTSFVRGLYEQIGGNAQVRANK